MILISQQLILLMVVNDVDVFDVFLLDHILLNLVDDKLIYVDLIKIRTNNGNRKKKSNLPSSANIGRASFRRKSEIGMFDVDVLSIFESS
jgi:hypothetical protein